MFGLYSVYGGHTGQGCRGRLNQEPVYVLV